MSVRQVRELPQRKTTKQESFVAKDVREFLRMGYEVAVVEADGRKPQSVQAALSGYIKANPKACKGLKVAVRQGKCYLYREGAAGDGKA